MFWLQYNVGGTLAFDDLPERADASPTFSVLSPSGGSVGTGTGTVDTVNTTLNGAVSAGATSFVVTSAAGITAGRRYLIGGTVATGGEWVTVKSVSGTTVTPVRPVIAAFASGATFYATRITCAVTAAMCTSIARHHRVELTYTVSAATRPVESLPFDVTRYALTSYLNLEHIRTRDPLFAKRLPAGTWVDSLLADTFNELLDHIAAQKDPGALVGTIDVTIPHGYLVREVVFETAGKDFEDYRKNMAQRFNETLASTLARHAFDDDQDNAIEANERFSPRAVHVARG